MKKAIKAWIVYDEGHECWAYAGRYLVYKHKQEATSDKEYVPEWDKLIRCTITIETDAPKTKKTAKKNTA